LQYNFKKVTKNYLFTSSRLGFRNWQRDDLDEFAALNADPIVMAHFPSVLSREETADFIDRLIAHFDRHGYNYFAVEVIDTSEFIGFIGLAYRTYEADFCPATDIGWRLKASAWSKGYATEGALRCLRFAFEELKLQRVISTCPLTNTKSEKVMKKTGMTKMGEFDHPHLKSHPDLERCQWYEIQSDPLLVAYSRQESERLIYRRTDLKDVAAWSEFFVNNDRLRFLAIHSKESEEELAKRWIAIQLERYSADGFGHLAVELKSTGKLVAMGGILSRDLNGKEEFEIAYSVIPSEWGQGYATEIAMTMKGFSMRHISAARFISIIDVENTDSAKVAVKNGMKVLFQTQFKGMNVNVFGIEKQ